MKITVSINEVNRLLLTSTRLIAVVAKVAGDSLPSVPEFPSEVTREEVAEWVELSNSIYAAMPLTNDGSIALSIDDREDGSFTISMEYSEELLNLILDVTDEFIEVVGEVVEKKKFTFIVAFGGLKALYHVVYPMVKNVVEPLKETVLELNAKLNAVVTKRFGGESSANEAAASEE